jgi:hypothetical protein
MFAKSISIYADDTESLDFGQRQTNLRKFYTNVIGDNRLLAKVNFSVE